MKYETFIKNKIRLFEKTMERGKTVPAVQNGSDAFYFIPDIETPYYAYRLEGMRMEMPAWDWYKGKVKTVDFERLFRENDAVYAEKDETETEWNGHKVLRFRTEDGEREGAFDKKYISLFPKNARFYLPRSRRSPAIVGLWENDRLQIIGCVCPMNI